MTGTILAGGENTRIPLLKGHIEINGKRIIDTGINLMRNLFGKVVISTNAPELYFYCGAPMIGDVIPQRGPLTGIFSVLTNIKDDAIFAVACDMPFLDERLMRHMADKYNNFNSRTNKWDAVIPVFEGKPQPLFGIYSKNILGVMEKRLDKGLRKLRDMLAEINVLYIKEEEVREIDPEGRSFLNINTMEDLEKIRGGKICLV
ncbi:MAG: molybdenum cofactor guanylyltransferase [Nitrospiraceae bacterium]|nr:MAG: molybdenum cofactor guanylyltransferase [Nitrospiraceae bacterium]